MFLILWSSCGGRSETLFDLEAIFDDGGTHFNSTRMRQAICERNTQKPKEQNQITGTRKNKTREPVREGYRLYHVHLRRRFTTPLLARSAWSVGAKKGATIDPSRTSN
ncbi:hypothetical protein J3459_012587 [Metarhizium acridum]|nr:hypothetical protein J3459_012587 [Metarhizium acridum]